MKFVTRFVIVAAMCGGLAGDAKAQDSPTRTVGEFKKIVVTPEKTVTVESSFSSSAEPIATLAEALKTADALIRVVEMLNALDIPTAGEKCYDLATRAPIMCRVPLPPSRPPALAVNAKK